MKRYMVFLVLFLVFFLGSFLGSEAFGQQKKSGLQVDKKQVVNTNTNVSPDTVASQGYQVTNESSETLELYKKLQEESLNAPQSMKMYTGKDIEYIAVGSKEKGIKVFLEGGGGIMVGGGVIWRFNPIFGIGGGLGYTPQPYIDFGLNLVVKAETIPIWFDIDPVKVNVLVGLQGIFFLGSMTQYVGANVGGEVLMKFFQYIIPSLNLYIYPTPNGLAPKLSFQVRVAL